MAELLDIVSEDDVVIGKDTRENIHQKHLIHRGIHVLVINRQKEILLQKRSKLVDYYPGYFDASVGVHVLSGETYEQAAVRETQEELGFRPQKLIKIADYHSYSERQKENRRLFLYYHDELPKSISKEVASVAFYSSDKIQQMIKEHHLFTVGFTISFNKYLQFIDKNQRQMLQNQTTPRKQISYEFSAGGIVYQQQGGKRFWLVIQHVGKKHWGFPKGHIGDHIQGEKAPEAALREVKEEADVTARILHPQPIKTQYLYHLGKSLQKKTVYYFLMQYLAGDINNHDWEIQEARFVPENEVKKTLTFVNDKKAFQQAKSFIDKKF